MTTLVHEAIVELFRSDGELLKELLSDRCDLREARPKIANRELTLVPAEFRADAVTVFRKNGKAHLAVVVEVQNTVDYRKRRSWPVYLIAAHATHKCPTLLFVMAIDDHVAKFARASIEIGHPGFCLKPIVITRDQIPVVKNRESARRLPRLAVLSALTHHSIEIAATALAVLKRTSPEYVEVYRDLIVSTFSKAEQKRLEKTMKHYEWKSERAKKQIAELKAESKKEGLREGRSQGRVMERREMVTLLARAKIGKLSSRDEAHIRRIAKGRKIARIMIGLASAKSPEQAKQVLR